MIRDPNQPIPEDIEPQVPRLFLREPGWRISQKNGSEREYCHNIAPGENAYHRLSDGELYVFSPDEKLCLPCADRRGLIHYEPKALRKPVRTHTIDTPVAPDDTIPVIEPEPEPDSE